MADWSKIKAEYIAGGISYRKLAEKHGVPFSNLKNIAVKEQWANLREQAWNRTTTELVDNIGKRNAQIDATYFRCVDKLMKKAEELIDTAEVWQPNMLKDMATTMKYLKECKGVKSDADIREQEARIKALEARVSIKDTEDEETGVVALPAVMEAPDG